MESLWNKYNKIKEVFYRDFVYDSSYTEQASCIPLSSVKNGVGWVGDGTINLAQYLQFLYTEIILGNKTEDDVNYDGKRDLIQNADEDVDCMTYAKDTSLYSNNSFFVFV